MKQYWLIIIAISVLCYMTWKNAYVSMELSARIKELENAPVLCYAVSAGFSREMIISERSLMPSDEQ